MPAIFNSNFTWLVQPLPQTHLPHSNSSHRGMSFSGTATPQRQPLRIRSTMPNFRHRWYSRPAVGAAQADSLSVQPNLTVAQRRERAGVGLTGRNFTANWRQNFSNARTTPKVRLKNV